MGNGSWRVESSVRETVSAVMPLQTYSFYKYSAAGNDFVVFDGRERDPNPGPAQIRWLCDRRRGIGADGVMVLSGHATAAFRMNYFNSDGSRGEMCGNGARSIVHFARQLELFSEDGFFLADDGPHKFEQRQDEIMVQIIVDDVLHESQLPFHACAAINTGVPHLLVPKPGEQEVDLDALGWEMNSHAEFPAGVNTNLIMLDGDVIQVRTWERGVNQETLACGTGATAAAIYGHERWGLPWPVKTVFKGGELTIDRRGNEYWLGGPVQLVFTGQIVLPIFQDQNTESR